MKKQIYALRFYFSPIVYHKIKEKQILNLSFLSLFRMCGREYPAASLVSIGNRMELKLKTDGSVNDRGFVASYRAIDL